MNDLKIDLDKYLFEHSGNQLELKDQVNIIFGLNGTGKSTLANTIYKTFSDQYDVRIYNGFENIISENKKLNAVLLGEENIGIEKKIEKINEEISKIQENIKISEKNLTSKKDQLKKFENKKKNCEKNIEEYAKKQASEIKKYKIEKISIVNPNYNKNNFIEDVKKSFPISDTDKKLYKDKLLIQIKKANPKKFENYDLKKLIEEANLLLSFTLNDIKLERLDNDEKINFAKKGLEIHKVGDRCAFCNNIINENIIKELKEQFSNSYNNILYDIDSLVRDIKNRISTLDSYEFEVDNFYPKYKEEANNLFSELQYIKNKEKNILNDLINKLENKKNKMTTRIFFKYENDNFDFDNISNKYKDLVKLNNENDLEAEKNDAIEKLKNDHIFFYKKEYDEFINEKNKIEIEYTPISQEIKKIEKDLEESNKKIEVFNNEIRELKSQTVNNQLIVTKINQVLKNKVAFELILTKNDNNGEYNIRCLRKNLIKDITEISQGEKNIIGFLYFLYKIEEISDNDKPKVIILDDPMTSNDSTMQYEIIEEIKNFITKYKKNENIKSELLYKLFIFTHSIHFYINLCNTITYRSKKYKTHGIYRLEKIRNHKIKIFKIEKEEEDLKNIYELYWYHLNILYKNKDVEASILLNTIRSILETYCMFNKLDLKDFCNVKGSNKLFNVNSHGTINFEFDINGKDKIEIIQILKDCFDNSGDLEHFNKYWLEVEETKTI